MPDFLLQANGDFILQADGVSKIILAGTEPTVSGEGFLTGCAVDKPRLSGHAIIQPQLSGLAKTGHD